MFRSSSPQPLPSPAVREAVARLDAIGGQRPELAEFIELYRELLPVLFEPAGEAALPAGAVDGVVEKLARGEAALRGVSLGAAEPALRDRWRRTCLAVGRRRPGDACSRLDEAVARGELTLAATLEQVVSSGPAQFHAQLAERGLDASLGSTVLRLAALPALAIWARSIEPRWVATGWPQGSCPACGSWPLLAEFRGLEQFRWLRCGLCAAGWQVDCVFCPFCATRDHRQLRDLVVEGQEQKYRLSVCDACGGFVRGIATLAPLSTPALLVADLETLHLELIAHSHGYSIANQVDAAIALQGPRRSS
jgi:FdhE protein